MKIPNLLFSTLMNIIIYIYSSEIHNSMVSFNLSPEKFDYRVELRYVSEYPNENLCAIRKFAKEDNVICKL